MIQFVNLRRTGIRFALLNQRVIDCDGGTQRHSVTVERLNIIADEQPEGISVDGRVLNIGALGIACLAEYLNTIPAFKQCPKRLHDRLCELTAGSMHGPAMIRATIRAVCGWPDVGGDTAYFKQCAVRQLEPWSTDDTEVSVVR